LTMPASLRMAVVGAGHFGRIHAEKIAHHARAKLVAVADVRKERAAEVARELGCRAAFDHRELIGGVDAVSVVVPTRHHFDVASAFLESGAHVLVEKPITHDIESARGLIDLARSRDLVLQVNHLVRFSALADVVYRQLTHPLYVESVRVTPFKHRGTDVNVILDLMIHDIDLVLHFVDSEIVSLDAAGAPVVSDTEDIANVRLKFANGCVASITASRISHKTERRLRIFQPDTYLNVDFDRHVVTRFRRIGGESMGSVPNVEVSDASFAGEDDPLARSIDSFIRVVLDGGKMLVSGDDGLRALEAATRVNECLARHAEFVADATELALPKARRSSG
ncbi:MAG: Gfo/Idh/MocA family protein, partial [Alphaproteobacteria bacterium]